MKSKPHFNFTLQTYFLVRITRFKRISSLKCRDLDLASSALERVKHTHMSTIEVQWNYDFWGIGLRVSWNCFIAVVARDLASDIKYLNLRLDFETNNGKMRNYVGGDCAGLRQVEREIWEFFEWVTMQFISFFENF